MALPNDTPPTAPLATLYITPDDVTVRTAVVKLPPKPTVRDIALAQEAAQSLMGGETGVVLPPGFDIEYLGPTTHAATDADAAVAAATRKRRLLGALSEHIAWGWLAAAFAWLLVWGVVSVYAYLFALLALLGDAFTGTNDAPWVIAAAAVWWVFGMVMLAALVMKSAR